MTPTKVINVFTDSELKLIKEAIEHKLKTTPMTRLDESNYTSVLKIVDRILARKDK